ncbi:MAG: hypothetical protein V7K69_32860 [Nostoc sp.]|uniref:hypothetical protein n=1 Tax=Nostoc sp. TaxID=1180 RepID=UPI002FF46AEC
MKRNPTLPPNFMLGYAKAAPSLQNYSSQGRRGLGLKPLPMKNDSLSQLALITPTYARLKPLANS